MKEKKPRAAAKAGKKNPGRREISVIVPAYNEEGNIVPLVKQLKRVLSQNRIRYEIIVVDDRSTDQTAQKIRPHVDNENVRYQVKQGRQGKAFSILEGAKGARYSAVAMIDADLQYPPAALPEMLDKLREGYDVVVANRNTDSYGFLRKAASRTFAFAFGKLLHRIDCDVQSGLKLFRKKVIEQADLDPTPWTFDLEFLLQAKQAGYRIGTVDIVFAKRESGVSKVSILKASYEIGMSAVKLKLKGPLIAPLPKTMERREGVGFYYNGTKYVPHTKLEPNTTALTSASYPQKLIMLLLAAGGLASFIINWKFSIIAFITVVTFIYMADFLFNLYLIYRSFKYEPEVKTDDTELESLADRDLPSYTIFCPLYREWQVLPQFVKAMSNLDYPQRKLQVILLLEEDDKKTVEKVKKYDLPSNFETVVIPHSLPKTKPKALNYGLKFARGKYAVVYDAEDIPDREQLKKAVLSFYKTDSKTVCIQAKLNFFNPHQNLLTRIFTVEYSLWFDLVLTGLQSIEAPIPLGGTSNHFPTSFLRKYEGWDAFNVTEDCDLGIRLFKNGYRTQILDSTTLEEANSDTMNWLRQRSRWIKGYIQTYLVHMRDLSTFDFRKKLHHFFSFQFIVGGKVFSMFVNPLMWVTTIVYFAFRPVVGDFIDSLFPGPVLYMGAFSLVFGNFLYLYYYMIGSVKRKHYDLVKYAFAVPAYWLGMSIAAWMAAYSLVFKPHYWAKTVHGLHLKKKKAPARPAKAKLVNIRYAFNKF